jgi:hypothetical protein
MNGCMGWKVPGKDGMRNLQVLIDSDAFMGLLARDAHHARASAICD